MRLVDGRVCGDGSLIVVQTGRSLEGELVGNRLFAELLEWGGQEALVGGGVGDGAGRVAGPPAQVVRVKRAASADGLCGESCDVALVRQWAGAGADIDERTISVAVLVADAEHDLHLRADLHPAVEEHFVALGRGKPVPACDCELLIGGKVEVDLVLSAQKSCAFVGCRPAVGHRMLLGQGVPGELSRRWEGHPSSIA